MKKQDKKTVDEQKNEKNEFVKLSVEQTITGTIQGFGKNNYGIFAVTDIGKISFATTVLQNILKANAKEFSVGSILEVTKHAKQPGKKYFTYTVKLNGEEISNQLESENLLELL